MPKHISGICFLVGLEKAKSNIKQRTQIIKRLPQLPQLPKFKEFKYFQRFQQAIILRIKRFERFADFKFVVPKKNINLIFVFAVLLIFGGLLANVREKRQMSSVKKELESVQAQINEANIFLTLHKEQEANDLFLGALEQIRSIVNTKGELAEQVIEIENNIESELFDLNKLVIIKDPELIFQFTGPEFSPQKITTLNNKIYFSSPYFNNIYELDENNIKTIDTNKRFSDIGEINQTAIFFSRPNSIFPFKDNSFQSAIDLKLPLENSELANLTCFKSNLYFLDKKTGQIMKYPYVGGFAWGQPQKWLTLGSDKWDVRSIAVDGSVWALRQNCAIDRYYAGTLQQEITIQVFPFCKNPTKIWTSPLTSYVYVLEPAQKRIIVLNKQGKIIKQYQSAKFDNLKDFAISDYGKSIYLLNGPKVYLISS